MYKIVNMAVLMLFFFKTRNQISSNKRVPEVRMLCSVNKAGVQLLFTYVLFCHVFQSKVAF